MASDVERRIGVTGHQLIPDVAREFVIDALRRHADAHRGSVVGVSSLAAGADQLFAEIVLAGGGQLEVIVPSAGYEASFESEAASDTYSRLLDAAVGVTTMPFDRPSEEAYWAAGQAIVDRSDELLAVWDGQPARGLGGTADVVAYARRKHCPVSVIWPNGVRRA